MNYSYMNAFLDLTIFCSLQSNNWTCNVYLNMHSLSVAQLVEYCVSSAKDCGFDSLGTHILIKKV